MWQKMVDTLQLTTSLVESNYLCVLGPEYVSNFIDRDLVIRVKRVDMMNHYRSEKMVIN